MTSRKNGAAGRRETARLVMEDGSEYAGWTSGRAHSRAGEVVFTTGMTGYAEALSDSSFYGQILVTTYPLIGNYGVPLNRRTLEAERDERGLPIGFESERVAASGLVVSELCETPSHHSSTATLAAWLDKYDVPFIAGVDTRALTKRLREEGVMRGKIITRGQDVRLDCGDVENPVERVSITEPRTYKAAPQAGGEGRAPLRIALVDCGVKANILRCLLSRGVEVVRLPWNSDLSGVEYDGLFLSNGPGDPKACGKTIATVRAAFSRGKPVFGVCLGNQIMALAAGADTYKLPYGHRAQNQPCVDTATGRCYITSQNHGYAVRAQTLPKDWECSFLNLNDGTIEGIRCKSAPFSAVQFHPEGCPGPRDTEYLIDRFLASVAGRRPPA